MLANCSTVGLYCVTKILQRILKISFQVTVVCLLMHVTVEVRHLWQVKQQDSDC